VLNRTVLFYRRHGRNLTQNRSRSHHDLAYALKMSLERRRRSGVADSLVNVQSPGSSPIKQRTMG
jgi:hypothetical protein